jgi:hypothetical protein
VTRQAATAEEVEFMSDENPYGGAGEPPDEPRDPARSPYQGYPAPPPGNYPSGASTPPGRSDRWKIWLGIGLAIPVLAVTGLLAGLLGYTDESGASSGIVALIGLLGPVVLLFPSATRKLALGLLIGYAALFILAAGACVALIASFA